MNTLFLEAPQLTAEIMRAHYCEHDLDKILPLFHETLTWIGAGEDQICYDYETIKDFFLRTYAEKAVPDCIITDEDYRLVSWDEHSCLVAGRCWIATKPETGYVLRAHQRVTFSYKLVDGDARRDNSPPGGVITPSKSLLHSCQQNYKNEGRGNFPPPCFYVLRRCLVNAGSQVAACSSCGLASGFSPLVSRATA